MPAKGSPSQCPEEEAYDGRVVAVETVLLVLLVVLVAGLLRSHAEILRRLGPRRAPADAAPAAWRLARRRRERRRAGVAGRHPGRRRRRARVRGAARADAARVPDQRVRHCAGSGSTLGERRLPAGVRTVVVTHGAERERPAGSASSPRPGSRW